MARKIRLTALVVNSTDDAPPVRFLIAVEADAKFSLVSSLIQQRYKENYSAGRRADYFFKKIQDVAGSDIDLRDTVEDLFGDIDDPEKRIVQMVSMPIDRLDTLPPDSFLRPSRPQLSPAQLEEVDRRRSEIDRYGSTVNQLDPDHPIDSYETPPAPAPTLPAPPPRRDTDGFAIPTKISRPTPSKKRSHALPNTSQSSYEDHLVSSQFQTPERHSATQYSTLEAVPSAQKPPPQQGHVYPTHRQAPSPELGEDPIQDSDHDQPRLSKSSNTCATSNTRETEHRKAAGRWSPDEYKTLIDLLAQDMSIQTIHQQHMPKRTIESIRKKSSWAHKNDSASIEERARTLIPWTDQEETWFIKAIRNDQDWRSLRDHRFRHRPNESVKHHYAEVRRRLEAEDQLRSSQDRYQEQVQRGEPSTGPNDKFTQDEDDVILLSRIEGAEMKGIAKERFPLRSPEQVTRRASTLYNQAKRDWQRSDPSASQRSPSVEILFAHDVSTRNRIVGKKAEVQSLKKKISENRTEEFAEVSHHKGKLARDRARTEERRVKEEQQAQRREILQKVQAEDKNIKRRRLNDDLEREQRYKKELAAWEEQAEIDREAGRPVQPRPERPLGSSIGTEVLISEPSTSQTMTTPSNKPTINAHSTRPSQTKASLSSSKKIHEKSQAVRDTPLPGSNTKSQVQKSGTGQKRRPSQVEVQVLIPAKKKQKTDQPEVTPARKTTSAKEKFQNTSASKSSSSALENKKGAQAARAGPGHHSDTGRFPAATQPAKTSKKVVPSPTPVAVSSPIAGPSRTSSHAFKQNLRQSTLTTFVSDKGSEKRPERPAITSAPKPDLDDSNFITDSESEYGGNGITDEELSAAAERSEAMYSSSQAEAPLDEQDDQMDEQEQPEEDPVFRSLMKSSPPVARSTPKAAFSQQPLASAPVQAETRAVPSTMPAYRVEVPMNEISPQTRAKPLPSPVISKRSEILGSDPSTPRNQGWTYIDHDIDMMDDGDGLQNSLQSGTQARRPASLNIHEANAAAGMTRDEIPESSDAYQEPRPTQQPASLSDRLREVHAEFEYFQEQLSNSAQTNADATLEEAQVISSDESSSGYETSEDEGETTTATVRATQTTGQPQIRPLPQAPAKDEVEDINVWRSQSGHSDEEEDMPSEASEEMPFPRSVGGSQSFGPFKYAPEVQNRKSSVAQEDVSPGTQRKGLQASSVPDAQPILPSSGKVRSPTPPKTTKRPHSSPTGSKSMSEPKSARRGSGRFKKRYEIRRSFELAADPPNLPLSTAPAVLHTKPSAKKDGKNPISSKNKATAGPTQKPSAVKPGRKSACTDKEIARPSETPSSKKQAKQPMTQSNGKAVTASGGKSASKAIKEAAPSSESEEDSEEESEESSEEEEHGTRSPVFFHDEFLWPTENLQNMTEEEILNVRLQNGVELRRRKREEAQAAEAAEAARAAEEERQASNAEPVAEPRANDDDSSSSSSSESSEDSDEEDAVTAMNRLGAMVEAEEAKRRTSYGWFV